MEMIAKLLSRQRNAIRDAAILWDCFLLGERHFPRVCQNIVYLQCRKLPRKGNPQFPWKLKLPNNRKQFLTLPRQRRLLHTSQRIPPRSHSRNRQKSLVDGAPASTERKSGNKCGLRFLLRTSPFTSMGPEASSQN